jgi:hypothetical protein
MVTNVSEESTASIFRVEDDLGVFLWKAAS